MLEDNKKYNETVKPNSLELDLLKQHFPQYFNKEGEFLISKFEQAISEDKVNLNKESFGINFLGKSLARYLSSTRTETYLAPHTEYNSLEINKNSENTYIIGDNLDALKHLLGSYTNKIKCIYIDPPYNTGSDGFVYNDTFEYTTEKLASLLSITEEEAQRIINLKGKSSHSAWLTFIYPRLVLARYLLSDDGVIFISIDDNEQANLKEMCDEIFGENNFVGQITVVNNPRGRDYGGIANMHEYLLCYKKSELAQVNNLEEKDKQFPYYDSISGFEIRELRNRNIAFNKDNRPNLYYPFYINENNILDNNLLEISLVPKEGYVALYPKESQGIKTVWRWGKDKSNENLNINIAAKKMKDDGYMIIEKYRKSDVMARSVWNTKQDNSEKGTLLIKNLFDGKKLFDFPKSMDMIKKIIEMGTNNDSIVLDFFSGSATTAHAVMQLNAEDSGNRKYILVQLPEQISKDKPAFKEGYKTIDEIGRKRIELAAQKIKAETNADIYYGFKVYSLKAEDKNTLAKQEEFDPTLSFEDESIEGFKTEVCSGVEAALTTYMLLDGYGLNATVELYKLDSYVAKKVQDTLYILDSGVTTDDLALLIERIESYSIDINRIVIFHTTLDFSLLKEFKTNLACLRHNRHIKLVERY